MLIKGEDLYHFLEKEKLTPELKQLKKKYDAAIKEWQDAWKALESDDLSVTPNAMKRLDKANEKIAKLKKEIQEQKAAQS